MIYLWYYLFKCLLITSLHRALGEQSTAGGGWRAWRGEGKSSPSSGHLQNLEPEVFGIYCSPEEVLWSIKTWFLAAGDHYGKHSIGHTTAAMLPEDGNVFGSEFGAFVPLMPSPSLLLPSIFQIAAKKNLKGSVIGPVWHMRNRKSMILPQVTREAGSNLRNHEASAWGSTGCEQRSSLSPACCRTHRPWLYLGNPTFLPLPLFFPARSSFWSNLENDFSAESICPYRTVLTTPWTILSRPFWIL